MHYNRYLCKRRPYFIHINLKFPIKIYLIKLNNYTLIIKKLIY
jgi:hypothetical protein